MKALLFIYIIEEVDQAHAQNTPLEWFLSTAIEQDRSTGCIPSDQHLGFVIGDIILDGVEL